MDKTTTELYSVIEVEREIKLPTLIPLYKLKHRRICRNNPLLIHSLQCCGKYNGNIAL